MSIIGRTMPPPQGSDASPGDMRVLRRLAERIYREAFGEESAHCIVNASALACICRDKMCVQTVAVYPWMVRIDDSTTARMEVRGHRMERAGEMWRAAMVAAMEPAEAGKEEATCPTTT